MRKLLTGIGVLLVCLTAAAQQPYPELGAKLDQYFTALAGEPADVQNRECDFLIESCEDSLVRQYVALKVYDHYLQSKIMGDDAVAVHVVQKWFLSGAVKMKSDEDYFNARIYAEFNKASLIGMQAPELVMTTAGNSLLNIPIKGGNYSVLFFYDAGCSTCKLETPRLLRLAQEGNYPVTVYAIYVGQSREAWDEWQEGKEVFTHLWDPGMESDWQRLYGVLQTPRMFLVSPSGKILGRGLDTPALEILLKRELSLEEYVYGEASQLERYGQLFASYGDSLKVEDVLSVADYLAQRSFGEGDVNAFKQIFGDLLYYLFSQRSEVFKDACIPFVQKYIDLPEIWTTEADKAQVTSLGEMLVTLTGRTPVGSQVPDLSVPGTLRRKGCLFRRSSKEGSFNLRELKGNPAYIVFYTGGCEACREILEKVDGIIKENRKARVLLVDMDALFSDAPAKANELLDTFDLSLMPFVLQLDKQGTVQHRYVQF